MESLWIAPYELRSAGPLNAQSAREVFPGVLVRKGEGFGCLHPWPELGDPTLEECLNNPTLPIFQRTLSCAEDDAAARRKGVSLFENLTVPDSHATLPQATPAQVEAALTAGFSVIKVKARGVLGELRKLILHFPMVKWRIDLNGSGEEGALKEEFAGLESLLDFVEDPFPYAEKRWSEFEDTTGVNLACDREVEHAEGIRIQIIKPAVNEMGRIANRGARRIFTSYMDHPLGQVFAAYEAARSGTKELCGLQTHHLFETNAFTEALGEQGPGFQIPDGVGLGFDDLLEELPWQKI
jgi:O-succinylbenzoate synthase